MFGIDIDILLKLFHFLNFRLEQNICKLILTTWDEYLKGLLQKIMRSYLILSELKDNSGDLDIIRKELLKITGFFNVIVTKLESEKFQSSNMFELKSKLRDYLNTYYFEKEIETMASLYSEDSSRIRNLRLKILESFEDKKLIAKIQNVIDDL